MINIGLVRTVPSILAQSLLKGSQKAVKKYIRPTFLLEVQILIQLIDEVINFGILFLSQALADKGKKRE